MAELINDPDVYTRLFSATQASAFKFEVRTGYGVAEEDEPFQKFLRGADPGLEWHEPWLDLMRRAVKRGIRVERVRVVDEPPSDFLRFEISMTPYNLDAGEDIRYMKRSLAEELRLPAVDYWLFDTSELYVLHFADDDRFQGLEKINDPAVVEEYAAHSTRAWARTVPFDADQRI